MLKLACEREGLRLRLLGVGLLLRGCGHEALLLKVPVPHPRKFGEVAFQPVILGSRTILENFLVYRRDRLLKQEWLICDVSALWNQFETQFRVLAEIAVLCEVMRHADGLMPAWTYPDVLDDEAHVGWVFDGSVKIFTPPKMLMTFAIVFMFSLPFSGARKPAAVIQNQAGFAWMLSAVPNSTPGGGWKGSATAFRGMVLRGLSACRAKTFCLAV